MKPAVFYVKRRPFLHFHESATTRGVDVREGKDWGERIELPLGRVSKTASTTFWREVKRRRKTKPSPLDPPSVEAATLGTRRTRVS